MTKYHYDEYGNNKGRTEKSDGCYLTTACVEYMGFDDNCRELTTLRHFRDTYMKENMKYEVDEYYVVAPKIVNKISSLDEERQRNHYNYIYEVITRCCSLIENNDNDEAYNEYKTMVKKLKEI